MNLKETIRRVLREDTNQVPDNFNKIPVGNNNYRSAQFTSAEQLKSTIKKYGIKHIVRLNLETEDGGIDKETENHRRDQRRPGGSQRFAHNVIWLVHDGAAPDEQSYSI